MLLVDGNALFKQVFEPNNVQPDGVHIGGVTIFTTLRKMLTDELYHRVYFFGMVIIAVYSDMSYTNL
jgi:hypothetical protein